MTDVKSTDIDTSELSWDEWDEVIRPTDENH